MRDINKSVTWAQSGRHFNADFRQIRKEPRERKREMGRQEKRGAKFSLFLTWTLETLCRPFRAWWELECCCCCCCEKMALEERERDMTSGSLKPADAYNVIERSTSQVYLLILFFLMWQTMRIKVFSLVQVSQSREMNYYYYYSPIREKLYFTFCFVLFINNQVWFGTNQSELNHGNWTLLRI